MRIRPDEDAGHTLVRPVDPDARPHLRRRGRPLHDRRVRRLPVRVLPQGLGLHPGGRRRTRRPAALHLAPRAAHAVPPNALAGAEASEAAALQGKFFEFERGLFADQENQRPSDILRLAKDLGLDVDRFERDLSRLR